MPRLSRAVLLAGSLVLLSASAAAAQAAVEPTKGSTAIVLSTRPDGTFALNQQPIPATELRETLRRVFVGRPTRQLHLEFQGKVDPEALGVLAQAAREFNIALVATPDPRS